jgi:prepilin-type N-terminal cleavage/methylation domain-containing protein
LQGTRRGFTLTEIMVVVVIIVLLIGMALPVFHALTGSRSEAGARNAIAATLGRARADAIGLDQTIGVAFVYNPSTQKSYLAEVYFPPCPEWVTKTGVSQGSCVKQTTGTLSYYFYWVGLPATPTMASITRQQKDYPYSPYGIFQWVGGPPLDIMPDTDLLPLPAGIGVQTICNTTIDSSGQRNNDGYLSVGVILFDGQGRLTSQLYGIPAASRLATAAGLPQGYPYHSLVGDTTGPNGEDGQNVGIFIATNMSIIPNQFGVQSQYGLVLFQKDAFVGQNFPTEDPTYNYPTKTFTSSDYTSGTGSIPSQQTEETWLDVNATPLLIDRYTGTVITGE